MAKPNPKLPDLSAQDIARFESLVDKESVNGPKGECHQWLGSQDKDGYGYFTAQGRVLRAHRVAYLLHNKVDPGQSLVCHTCDYPPCCNGGHFFLGDHAANAADRQAKNRGACGPRKDRSGAARGERQHLAKLTAEIVIQIRELRADGLTQIEIADRFPFISRRAIGYVLTGSTWAHV